MGPAAALPIGVAQKKASIVRPSLSVWNDNLQ
jgi:hypothetical protein